MIDEVTPESDSARQSDLSATCLQELYETNGGGGSSAVTCPVVRAVWGEKTFHILVVDDDPAAAYVLRADNLGGAHAEEGTVFMFLLPFVD